jgi:hypothetical protein
MLDRLLIYAATIILCACYTAPKQDGVQGTPKAQNRPLLGTNGCLQGMNLLQFDSLGRSVCLPIGRQWRTEKMASNDRKGFSIYVFSPPNSSPLIYGEWNAKGDYDDVHFNILGEPYTHPESDFVLMLGIERNSLAEFMTWDRIREKLIISMNLTHEVLSADTDTLDDLELFIRQGLLLGETPHIGGAWSVYTRNEVHWAYSMWARRLKHSGQIRAGIFAINEHDNKKVYLSAHWIRKDLPKDLDEVRSDSLFVIFNEVVESFKWAE